MSRAVPAFRNICFVGHTGAGKTSLVDALAFAAGAVERRGSVADGTSVVDTEPEAQEKGHTLQLGLVHAEHGACTWNWIDTPGNPDFEAEARCGMFAADLVVGVVSAQSGVSTALVRLMELAAELDRPRALIVTHLDTEQADFETLVLELRDAIGEVCVPVLLPEGERGRLSGVHRTYLDRSTEWRKRMLDRVVDGVDDEALIEHYLESDDLTEEELKSCLPVSISANCLIPVLVANPVDGVGIPEVLDFLRRAGPTPAHHRHFVAGDGPVDPDADAALLGVVFAVRADPHVGRVCLARILSGTLSAHEPIGPVGSGTAEKVGGLFAPVGGKRRHPLESAVAGAVVAFTKVEGLGIGQTFTRDGGAGREVEFPELPEPMVSLALQPKSRADEQKIAQALHKLEAEDPALKVHVDSLTHELVVTGASELHLGLVETRLHRRFHVGVTSRAPRIAYRETITRPAEATYRHKKQSGGRGQFGECSLRLRPAPEGAGIVFVDKVVGGAIPRNLIPAVERGVRELAEQGVLTHNRVVDVEVEVFDGKFHAVDSDEASFRTAGAHAFRQAFEAAGPALLEPIVHLDVHVPTDCAGSVFSDLTSQRRGHVLSQESEGRGDWTHIQAEVPLSRLATYARDLKSQTAGQGHYRLTPRGYAPMPAPEQKRVVAEEGRTHAQEA